MKENKPTNCGHYCSKWGDEKVNGCLRDYIDVPKVTNHSYRPLECTGVDCGYFCLDVSKEERLKELIGRINFVAGEISKKGRIGIANYIQVPVENIEMIAENLDISEEETIELLADYFKSKKE